MNRKLILATNNEHKVSEISHKLKPLGIEAVAQKEVLTEPVDAEETGETLDENALIKAKAVWDLTGGWVMADDSGLFVQALNGEPGVHSARYAGVEHDDKGNNDKLLKKMKNKNHRKGAFKTAIALIDPDGNYELIHGECPGDILHAPRGDEGFGYDPIFQPEGYDVSFAEMREEEKNKISHRARALEALVKHLEACDELRSNQ